MRIPKQTAQRSTVRLVITETVPVNQLRTGDRVLLYQVEKYAVWIAATRVTAG